MLAQLIMDNTEVRVLAAVRAGRGGLSLNKVAQRCNLTPRGASLVLKRLELRKVVRSTRKGQYLYFRLSLSKSDEDRFEILLKWYRHEEIAKQAMQRQDKHKDFVPWIKQAYRVWGFVE